MAFNVVQVFCCCFSNRDNYDERVHNYEAQTDPSSAANPSKAIHIALWWMSGQVENHSDNNAGCYSWYWFYQSNIFWYIFAGIAAQIFHDYTRH